MHFCRYPINRNKPVKGMNFRARLKMSSGVDLQKWQHRANWSEIPLEICFWYEAEISRATLVSWVPKGFRSSALSMFYSRQKSNIGRGWDVWTITCTHLLRPRLWLDVVTRLRHTSVKRRIASCSAGSRQTSERRCWCANPFLPRWKLTFCCPALGGFPHLRRIHAHVKNMSTMCLGSAAWL